MHPILLPIYGSIAIHSYGVMIALGVLVFYYLQSSQTRLQKYITTDDMQSILAYNIVAALIGGKLLYVMFDPPGASLSEFFTGGFSVLGSALSVFATTLCYFYYHAIPLLPTIDLLVLHAPILHIFGRIGCFLAGCCYGTQCSLPWAITYTHTASLAPLGIPLHPAQLYSAILCTIIYAILLTINQFSYKPLVITSTYIWLFGTQRFLLDFVRSDHHDTIITYLQVSQHQIISLCVAISGFICLIGTIYYHHTD